MSSISRNAIEACGCPGHLVSDSGIATKRGWGRGDPSRAPALLDSHRIAFEGQ